MNRAKPSQPLVSLSLSLTEPLRLYFGILFRAISIRVYNERILPFHTGDTRGEMVNKSNEDRYKMHKFLHYFAVETMGEKPVKHVIHMPICNCSSELYTYLTSTSTRTASFPHTFLHTFASIWIVSTQYYVQPKRQVRHAISCPNAY